MNSPFSRLLGSKNRKLLLALDIFSQEISVRNRKKIILIALLQPIINFLDLIAVALVGLLGALAISGIQARPNGNKVSQFLRFIDLDNQSIQSQVAFIGIVITLLFLFRTIFSLSAYRRSLKLLSECAAETSANLYEFLMTIPLAQLRKLSGQENLYAVTGGVQAIFVGIVGGLISLLSDLSLVIIIFVGILVLEPSVAIFTTVYFGLIGIVMYLLQTEKAHKLGKMTGELTVEANQIFLESLNSYRELLVKGKRKFFYEKFKTSRVRMSNVLAEQSLLPIMSKYIIEIALIIGGLLISAFQFLLNDSVHATANLGIFIASASRIAPAIIRIQTTAINFRISIGSAGQSISLLQDKSELSSKFEIQNVEIRNSNDFNPTISIRNLEFRYVDSKTPVFTGLNLEILPREFIAVTGRSGSGKSTLIDCIIGAHEPSSGSIEISGVPNRLAIKSWPGLIGYVPQKISILNSSLRANITFGYEENEISNELLDEALSLSHLKELIMDLPLGLETPMGDFGSKLSGGQVQRVGIARALLSKPKILILDEATSALDGITESQITESLIQLNQTCTLIVIAHRLSTVKSANKIFYLDGGKVKASGNFETLRIQIPDFDRQAELMGL